MATKFYIELPFNSKGQLGVAMAVVEARIEGRGGSEIMIPVAPPEVVTERPHGWHRDGYGGWVETDGPARMLTHAEYASLIAKLSEAAKSSSGTSELKNGRRVPNIAVPAVMTALRGLEGSNQIAFCEAVRLARDPGHELWDGTQEVLRDAGILDHAGRMNEVTRAVIVSAVEGDSINMTIVDPLADAA